MKPAHFKIPHSYIVAYWAGNDKEPSEGEWVIAWHNLTFEEATNKCKLYNEEARADGCEPIWYVFDTEYRYIHVTFGMK